MKQRIAGEEPLPCLIAEAARGMSRGMQHGEGHARISERLSFTDGTGRLRGGNVPPHQPAGIELGACQHGRVLPVDDDVRAVFRQLCHRTDVVKMAVGQQDGFDPAALAGSKNALRLCAGINDNAAIRAAIPQDVAAGGKLADGEGFHLQHKPTSYKTVTKGPSRRESL